MPKDNSRRQARGRKGPGMNVDVAEKPKDFKGAIKRLFHELGGYKTLIIISFLLAIFGSILSILAPDKLSDLTDEISSGLVINQKNLEEITAKINDNFDQEKMQSVAGSILQFNLSETNLGNILTSSDISSDNKQKLQDVITKISTTTDQTTIMNSLFELDDSVLKELLTESIYEGNTITVEDKIGFIKVINSKDNTGLSNLPQSMQDIFFSEIEVAGITLSANDQYQFVTIMSTLKEDSTAQDAYKKIDQLPVNIQDAVKPFMDMTAIRNIGLILLVMYLCSALFTYIESICMTNVSNKFANFLRGRISTKINKLPLKYFDKHFIGDILSRVTNDVDTIAQSMNQSLATLVSSVTLFIGAIVMMFYTNWLLAITAIVSSLLGFVGMFIILGKSQKYFVARQEELGNLNGHIEEIYSGLNVVKVYNGKANSDKKFDSFNKKVCDSNRKSQFLSGLMMPMMHFIGNFGYVAVCIVGALLALNGKISFGVIVAFISYVRLFNSPLSQIAQSMTSLQSTAAASERVFEFLDEEEMRTEKDVVKSLEKDKVKGQIEFDNVEFTYDGNDKPTIYDFSVKAFPGQKVAIVGPTGAGKTTLVNLLMKFYEINSGDIKIDDVSTKELTRANVHELFTMVLQDSWLFDGTVKENIVYNRENVSDARIKEVCKEVGVDHFIRTLPKSYNSVLSENDSVSAGQRQLLTIARGMVEDAPFLILDEATSNVDTRTEELVQHAMDKLTEGKTSFIIAHRLSTIRNADLILVMKDGNIIEQGNHEQLMKQKGFYSELYNSQFEL